MSLLACYLVAAPRVYVLVLRCDVVELTSIISHERGHEDDSATLA